MPIFVAEAWMHSRRGGKRGLPRKGLLRERVEAGAPLEMIRSDGERWASVSRRCVRQRKHWTERALLAGCLSHLFRFPILDRRAVPSCDNPSRHVDDSQTSGSPSLRLTRVRCLSLQGRKPLIDPLFGGQSEDDTRLCRLLPDQGSFRLNIA